MSPPRSDGLLHVTLTAKHNVQEHKKKMRVIEVSRCHCTEHVVFKGGLCCGTMSDCLCESSLVHSVTHVVIYVHVM